LPGDVEPLLIETTVPASWLRALNFIAAPRIGVNPVKRSAPAIAWLDGASSRLSER